MKKIIAFLMAVLTLALVGCQDDAVVQDNNVTITFIQENQPTITRTIVRGEDLKNIPQPVQSFEQYFYVWDKSDFTMVINDLTVNAIKKDRVNVTFVQEGEPDIVVPLAKGYTLTDIPVPKDKNGKTFTWDISDFTNIVDDIIVHAVTEFVITYKIEKQYIYKQEECLLDRLPNNIIKTNEDDKFLYFTQNRIRAMDTISLFQPLLINGMRQEYVFDFWTVEENGQPGLLIKNKQIVYDFGKDITLTASFIKQIKEQVLITFIQKGQPNIVISIDKGSDLTAIPKPKDIDGEEYIWNTTDFTNITADKTVIAMLKGYTLTYKIEKRHACAGKTCFIASIPDNLVVTEDDKFMYFVLSDIKPNDVIQLFDANLKNRNEQDYLFEYWYLGEKNKPSFIEIEGNEFVFDFHEDIVLTASFFKQYTNNY